MKATPVGRVTPPWDVYMANCHPGWQGYPTWQTGQPAKAGQNILHQASGANKKQLFSFFGQRILPRLFIPERISSLKIEISEQANINIDKGKKICQKKQLNLGIQLVFPVYFQSHYKFTVSEGMFSRWNLNFSVEQVINLMNAIWWEHLCICGTLQTFPCELKLAHACLLQQIFALKSCRTQVQVCSNQLRLARWVTDCCC